MAEEPTQFASPTNIQWNGHTGVAEYGGGDRGMVAMFYNRPVHNPAKSTQAGRPVFEDQVYVRIHPPGERLNIIDRPAKGDDSRRWPQQWQQFVQNKQQIPDGTPIGMLYPDYPSVAEMLKAFAVHTVEQCAQLSGPAIDTIGMGAQRYVNDAQKYLAMSSKGVKAGQFRHEMEEKDREIKVLNQKVEALMHQVDQLKENNAAQGNVATAIGQALMNAQQHPVYPPPPPQQTVGVDTQLGIINATHPTAQIPRRRAKPRLGG